jgi:hypothetical protein
MANVELKVITSTFASLAVGIGLAILNAVQADHSMMGSLGPTYQAIILAIVPALITGLVGYQTRHTARPDLGAAGS